MMSSRHNFRGMSTTRVIGISNQNAVTSNFCHSSLLRVALSFIARIFNSTRAIYREWRRSESNFGLFEKLNFVEFEIGSKFRAPLHQQLDGSADD